MPEDTVVLVTPLGVLGLGVGSLCCELATKLGSVVLTPVDVTNLCPVLDAEAW